MGKGKRRDYHMPARPKVDRPAVETALLQNHGDVAASARQLGISRAALYNRVSRFHIDLGAYRKVDASVANLAKVGTPGATDRPVDDHQAAPNGHGGRGSNRLERERSRGDETSARRTFNFPRANDAPILPGVPSQTVTDVDADADRPVLRESRSYFLPPEQIDLIRQAKFDLQALLRVELSDSKVLERFIAAKFSEWIAEEKRASAPRPARKGKDKPDEGGR